MMQENYPFDFCLEITYFLEGNSLKTSAAVSNRSTEQMPHYLGWHPWFITTDKTKLRLSHTMQKHYNYFDCCDEKNVPEIDLSKSWDDVFYDPVQKEFSLYNEADGYWIRYLLDDAHSVLTVCTTSDHAICLEPWCGLPDSINNGKLLQWISPGKTECYHTELQVGKMQLF